jgi:hypothetical protein
MGSNKSRTYLSSDTSGLRDKPEKAVCRPRPTVVFNVGDVVDVCDVITGQTAWTGTVTAIAKSNGILTVQANTARDRRGRVLVAKFSRSGHATGDFSLPSRRIRHAVSPDSLQESQANPQGA